MKYLENSFQVRFRKGNIMSDTPSASNEAPKTAPPGEAKPGTQDNTGDSKPSPDAPKQK
jgi:hypothetical protein